MKRFFFTAAVLLCALYVYGQYVPNTQWPYLYPDFTEGTVYYDNETKGKAMLNIHLLNSELHFLKGNDILKTDGGGIVRIEIGEDAYLYVDGRMMKITGRSGKNLLMKLVLADFDALLGNTGAYGANSNTHSRRDLSSLGIAIGGIDLTDHGKMLQNRSDGKELDEVVTYCFIINDQTVEAGKNEVGKIVPEGKKAEWKTFLKQNKIKWKKENSLITVLNFFQ